MKLNYFKDKLFELLNEEINMEIKDITANDREDKFTVEIQDGSVFEVKCTKMKTTSKIDRPFKKDIRFYWKLKNY
ncbi:hypothetical protein IMSAGC011_01179 [Lachnospiraceae bacterium]|nr:hypothetical protein IMSAGC011_01179 [Lachnospiraceae bacterium]